MGCCCVQFVCVCVYLGSLLQNTEGLFDEDSLHADTCFTGQGQTGTQLQDSGHLQTHLLTFGHDTHLCNVFYLEMYDSDSLFWLLIVLMLNCCPLFPETKLCKDVFKLNKSWSADNLINLIRTGPGLWCCHPVL